MLPDDLSGNLYQFDREGIFDLGARNIRPIGGISFKMAMRMDYASAS
jgi:hypothetical protein